jgi:formylmethanofuran dehydrogenase subunit D
MKKETFKYKEIRNMSMQKIVKKSGNSHFIRLDHEDIKILGLKEGDTIDVVITIPQKSNTDKEQ